MTTKTDAPREAAPFLRAAVRRALSAIRFAGLYLWELLISNITVARIVLFRPTTIRPKLITFRTELKKDSSVLLLANLISMTPGTLSVDFNPVSRELTVHGLDVTDEVSLLRDLRDKFERNISAFME